MLRNAFPTVHLTSIEGCLAFVVCRMITVSHSDSGSLLLYIDLFIFFIKLWHWCLTLNVIYTVSLFWNRSQKYRSNKSSSDFAICLHVNLAAM